MEIGFCCLLLASVTVSLAQQAPQLSIMPAGETIRRDLDVTGFFTCLVDDEHEQLIDDIVWMDPHGDEVPDELDARVYTARTTKGNGLELYVNSIVQADAGNYTCKARYSTNQEITKSFTLLVYQSIRFEDAPKVQNPVVGGAALIKCVVTANPPAIVEWFRGQQTIRSNDKYTTQENGLLIQNISSEDNGVYTCRAKVPAEGQMMPRHIEVEVYSRPEITEPTPDMPVEVAEGKEGSVRCLASGNPTPSRTWLGPDGADASLTAGLVVSAADGTLTFAPARRDMAGRYRCIAANQVASVETAIFVVVNVSPEVTRLENVTSTEGGRARLECHVTGAPLPVVSFRKMGSDDEEYEELSSGGRINVAQQQHGDVLIGVLAWTELSRDDDGLYECTASNKAGQQSRSGLLTVQYPPTVTGQQTTVFTWAGHAANLSCRARAAPNASLAWTVAGRRIDDPQIDQIVLGTTSVLRVTPNDNSYYRVYTCTAVNELGSNSLDFTLEEATAPAPPAAASFQDVTATSVGFDLTEPDNDGGLSVDGYAVRYALKDEPWETHEELFWPVGERYLLQGLTPNQTYVFRFAAGNSVGTGEWSEQQELSMPKIAPPQPPKIITTETTAAPMTDQTHAAVRSEHSDSFELRWEPAADNGAEVDSYEVSYYEVVNNDVWRVVLSEKRTSVVPAPGPLTFRMSQLKPKSYYQVELRAHNRLGFGGPSKVIIYTAPDVAKASAAPESLASSVVIGVVIGVLLVLLLLIDLTCYVVNSRGITHMICSSARGSSGSAKLNDEAASEKEPLQENGNGNDSKSTTGANCERDVPEVMIDKAQLDEAKDSAV